MINIIWTEDAAEDLIDIVAFQKAKYGSDRARKVYDSIQNAIHSISNFAQKGRVVPELVTLGITSYNEVIHSPWRILYKISNDSIYITSLIDGRRNVEEILYKKVIDGKI